MENDDEHDRKANYEIIECIISHERDFGGDSNTNTIPLSSQKE